MGLYLLEDGTVMSTYANSGGKHCGALSIIDLYRYLSGILPDTTSTVTSQQDDTVRMVRELVATCADDIDALAYGEFPEEASAGVFRFTIEVEELPLQELMCHSTAPIAKRKTWKLVALHGWWDLRHMEVAANLLGIDNFTLVKATATDLLVPCQGSKKLEAHVPMVLWHPHGHFELVFPHVPEPAARKPVAPEQSATTRKPVVAKDDGDGWTLVGKSGRAKRSSAVRKVCAMRFQVLLDARQPHVTRISSIGVATWLFKRFIVPAQGSSDFPNIETGNTYNSLEFGEEERDKTEEEAKAYAGVGERVGAERGDTSAEVTGARAESGAVEGVEKEKITEERASSALHRLVCSGVEIFRAAIRTFVSGVGGVIGRIATASLGHVKTADKTCPVRFFFIWALELLDTFAHGSSSELYLC